MISRRPRAMFGALMYVKADRALQISVPWEVSRLGSARTRGCSSVLPSRPRRRAGWPSAQPGPNSVTSSLRRHEITSARRERPSRGRDGCDNNGDDSSQGRPGSRNGAVRPVSRLRARAATGAFRQPGARLQHRGDHRRCPPAQRPPTGSDRGPAYGRRAGRARDQANPAGQGDHHGNHRAGPAPRPDPARRYCRDGPGRRARREVRAWARAARYDVGDHDGIPPEVIVAYNDAHPDRPY